MRAVFWDLDDTVLNTLPGRMVALAGTYEDCLGTRPDAEKVWREHNGQTLEALARDLLGDDWLRFAERYRERYYALDIPSPSRSRAWSRRSMRCERTVWSWRS